MIIDISQMSRIVEDWRSQGITIVMCHGCFDPLHAGHIDYFMKSKKLGDRLIVSITADEYVRMQKGAGRPFLPIQDRMSLVDQIESVDLVVESKENTSTHTLDIARPDIYCKGIEYASRHTDMLDEEKSLVEGYGGRIEYIRTIGGISSTRLIHNTSNAFDKYIESLPTDTYDNIMRCLDNISKLNVLVIGETIIDKYTYVNVLHKAPKTSILASKIVSSEAMAGAAVFISNILSSFVNHVTLITNIGNPVPDISIDPMKFISERVSDNATLVSIGADRPAIIKHRYLEHDFKELYHRDVLFEPIYIDDSPLSYEDEYMMIDMIVNECERNDIVIVSDFGHGLISRESAKCISDNSKYLCLNTQTNESNYGMNVMSKYPMVDYTCIDEIEIRLNYRDQYGNIEELINRGIYDSHIDNIICVTSGPGGAIVANMDGITRVPCIPNDMIVDRIGAGDAFLSVSSLLAYDSRDRDLIGMSGNIAGALKVQSTCTKSPITRDDFIGKLGKIFNR